MANNKKIETTKKDGKNTTKKNTTTKTTVSKPKTSTKKVSTKQTTNKSRNSNREISNKKTTQVKKNTQPKEKKEVVVEEKVKSVELTNVLEKDDKYNKNSNTDNSKSINTRNSRLLYIGIFIAVIGIIALLVSLIANRIIDREFLSDNAITFMLVCSILIEGFGAFIIINEA